MPGAVDLARNISYPGFSAHFSGQNFTGARTLFSTGDNILTGCLHSMLLFRFFFWQMKF
jgi:hypothetical protein